MLKHYTKKFNGARLQTYKISIYSQFHLQFHRLIYWVSSYLEI